MKYYRFRVSLFKLDDAKTFAEQVNNAPDEKAVSLKLNPAFVQVLHDAVVRDNWTEITEQEYTTERAAVLAEIGS